MRVVSAVRFGKLPELSLMGALAVCVMAADAPSHDMMHDMMIEGPSVDSAAAVDTIPSVPTLLDSIRAEAALPAVALRRPIERYLGRFNKDRVLVRRISLAVLRESRRQQVPPSLITAVLLTENTTLRPEAESSVGAQGLMQVMPFHAGARLCNSDDLVDVDSNICHGTLILARNLRVTSSSSAALLRYNGCVRGTNTPDCHRYPGLVLARASAVRREILASAGDAAMLGTALAKPVQLAER
jgi:soluble lytic murein transglycosylase-like protein